MPTPIGTGSLFQETAHKRFMTLTGSRYKAMMERLSRKKLIDKDHPPFTLDQIRAKILAAMDGKEDGFIQCRYCRGFFGIADISMDHEIALSRRGSVGIENIGFPCQRCNNQKGKLSPAEFLLLLEFMEKHLPLARTDILERLEKAVQFAASIRSNAPVINELKERGEWKHVQDLRRKRKRDKEAGLGAF